MIRATLAAALALASTAASAVDAPHIVIAYELKSGSRPIRGVSHELEWLFVPLEGERARMVLRVPVDSFSSTDGAVDAEIRRAVGGEHHPFLQIDGIAVQGRLEGTLELAGVAHQITVQLHTERFGGSIVAVGSFTIDLRDYGLHPDGVDPQVSFDVSVRLVASKDAVLAGGFVGPGE